jgi:hypothetical protein
MKHGHHIPASDRDDMARLAVAFTESMPDAEAKKTICGLFDVSEPTARNLISRGRYLAEQADADPARKREGVGS